MLVSCFCFPVGSVCRDPPWSPLASSMSPAETREETLAAAAAAAAAAVEERQKETAAAEGQSNSGLQRGSAVVPAKPSEIQLHSGESSKNSSSSSSSSNSSDSSSSSDSISKRSSGRGSRCSSSMRISSNVSSRSGCIPSRSSSSGGLSCSWDSGESEGEGDGANETHCVGGALGVSSSEVTFKGMRAAAGDGFYKTKMCHFFQRGLCIYGHRCSYAHALSEIRQPLNLRKTRLCVSFKRGQCNAADCKFAHGQEELRPTASLYKTQLCLFWLAGKCG